MNLIRIMSNALSHRDYYEQGATTMIEVYDDRVEITNPGGLLSGVKKDFGKKEHDPQSFDIWTVYKNAIS